MKNLFGKLLIVLALAVGFVSCMKDDSNDDWLKQLEEQERMIDSVLSADKIKIKEYIEANLPDAIEDTVTFDFEYLKKPNVKRGIWYKVHQLATDDSYEYQIVGNQYKFPRVKLNYTAKLLDGTLVETAENENFDFDAQSSVINNTWFISFFPYSIRLNSNDIIAGGLTEDGLKTGSIITVVTPSQYAYGTSAKTNIPANSPLVYEFEVLSIQ